MPKNKLQEVIFTIMMVIVMVYVMICYNIALNTGGLQNSVFLSAFRELAIMGPIAFLLDFFLVGGLAKKIAFQMVDVKTERPFHLILAISAVSVAFMCPLMSLAATILFKDAGVQFVSVWLQTTAFNFPMALFWQLFYAGPLVRFLFRHIFKEKQK
jgi:DNA-binding transcriptional regulator of glucitol operon